MNRIILILLLLQSCNVEKDCKCFLPKGKYQVIKGFDNRQRLININKTSPFNNSKIGNLMYEYNTNYKLISIIELKSDTCFINCAELKVIDILNIRIEHE